MSSRLFRFVSLWLALGLSAAAAQSEVPSTPSPKPMTFEFVDSNGLCESCVVVQAQGRIVGGDTARDLWTFVLRNHIRKPMVLALHSQGGSMQGAMEVGGIVRKLGARTLVGRAIRKDGRIEIAPGTCMSACPMIFAGGIHRAVPAGSALGVHAWMPVILVEDRGDAAAGTRPLDRKTMREIQSNTASYMRFYDAMGIDLRLMVRILQTPYERMYRLGPQELREFKLVTEEPQVTSEAGRSRPVLVLPGGAVAPPPAARRNGRRAG